MVRALLAVVATVVAYFALCFLVGAVAGAQAGAKNPSIAAEAGARAGARAVEDNRPYLIGGAIMIGVLTGGFVPLGRKRRAPAAEVPEVTAAPAVPPANPDDPWSVPEEAVYKAPNPLRHLVKPALLVIPLGMVATFWYFVISGYSKLQHNVGGSLHPGAVQAAPGFQLPAFQPVQPPQFVIPPIQGGAAQPPRVNPIRVR